MIRKFCMLCYGRKATFYLIGGHIYETVKERFKNLRYYDSCKHGYIWLNAEYIASIIRVQRRVKKNDFDGMIEETMRLGCVDIFAKD